LINFDDGYFERPNLFYSEDNPADPKFLTRLSGTPETSGIPVFMISGVSGTRNGVMLNSNSYVGGNFGENLCRVWNVILSGSACELCILEENLWLTVYFQVSKTAIVVH
jgi:hypothetical protein